MSKRNRISRQAARFLRQRERAWAGLKQLKKYYVAFSEIAREGDAEETRVNMHAALDAWCDAERAKNQAMGGP